METGLSTRKTGDEARPSIAIFQKSIKDAGLIYRNWVEKQSFVHKDFDISGALEKIKAIWVPVWLFEVSAESAWHGSVSHTESYTEWETKCGPGVYDSRQVPVTKERTVWTPISGNHYDNYLVPVSASREINQEEIWGLKYKQLDLRSYDESYLDGWQVQATDLNRMEAKDICNRRIQNLEERACKYEVESFGGCSTKVTYNTSNFVLLPMFVLSYTYKDKSFRNLINGVTGEGYGDLPINKAKKYLFKAVQVIVGVIVGLFILFIIFAIMANH